MSKETNILIALAIVALVIGGAIGAVAFSTTELVPVKGDEIVIDLTPEQYEEAFNDGVKSVIVTPPTYITELVESDDYIIVYNYMYDMNGDMTELMEDLDDDEISLLGMRVLEINDAKALSVVETEDELFDELDRESIDVDEEEFFFDEDEMSKLRIDDDLNEISVLDSDFDNHEFMIGLTGTFKQDDTYFTFEVEVEIEDGYVDSFEVVDVSVRD